MSGTGSKRAKQLFRYMGESFCRSSCIVDRRAFSGERDASHDAFAFISATGLAWKGADLMYRMMSAGTVTGLELYRRSHAKVLPDTRIDLRVQVMMERQVLQTMVTLSGKWLLLLRFCRNQSVIVKGATAAPSFGVKIMLGE